jgi:hypothetical protein
MVIANPPKMVYDESGRLVDLILSAEEFREYRQISWRFLDAN